MSLVPIIPHINIEKALRARLEAHCKRKQTKQLEYSKGPSAETQYASLAWHYYQ